MSTADDMLVRAQWVAEHLADGSAGFVPTVAEFSDDLLNAAAEAVSAIQHLRHVLREASA